MQETQVLSLDQEDLLENEMATYSGILTWRIPCTEEPGGLQAKWSQNTGTTCNLPEPEASHFQNGVP